MSHNLNKLSYNTRIEILEALRDLFEEGEIESISDALSCANDIMTDFELDYRDAERIINQYYIAGSWPE